MRWLSMLKMASLSMLTVLLRQVLIQRMTSRNGDKDTRISESMGFSYLISVTWEEDIEIKRNKNMNRIINIRYLYYRIQSIVIS